jgi:peptide/nickel transport system substrate-binding protein
MKWSDGMLFNADAVIFWYEAFTLNETLNPSGISSLKSSDGEMGVIEKIDDYTIRITFNRTNPLFLDKVGRFQFHPYLPEHYMGQFHPDYTTPEALNHTLKEEGFASWEKLFTAKMDVWSTGVLGISHPGAPTISPWMATNERGSLVWVLERNPYYFKVDPEGNQLPYLDGVQNFLVNDLETGYLKIFAGDVDVEFACCDNPSHFRINEDVGDYRTTPAFGSPGFVTTIFFNLTHENSAVREAFLDRRFRVALSVAMDRDEMNEVFRDGLMIVSNAAPADGPPYHGESEKYTAYTQHDPSLANELLDEMGLKWDANRETRLLPDGSPAQFVLMARTDLRVSDVPMLEMLQQDWKAVGIDISINPRETAFITERVAANKFDMFTGGGTFGGGVRPTRPGVRSTMVPSSPASWNQASPRWTQWVHSNGTEGNEPPGEFKRLYELYREFLLEAEEEARIALENEMLAIHAENLWFLVVLKISAISPTRNIIVHNRMHNVPLPLPGDYTYGKPETWSIGKR